MQCLSPTYLSKQDMVVPCGRCSFCASTRRSDWSVRLQYEAKLHLEKKFLTLTYANAHLVWAHGCSQLEKTDLQKFFRAIRKAGYKIRYYAVGEYGSKTYRPHYHVILFGEVPDRVIKDAWKKGHVHIGTVTQASIAYCLGYLVNGKSWKMHHKRVAPFSLMSLKPGLGANYLSKAMVDWHRSGRKNYVLVDGLRKHLPRYYKTKIFSKIDLVRIAVRDQKDLFKRMVKWIRAPAQRRMKDPLKYRREQELRLAKQIRFKSKDNLII